MKAENRITKARNVLVVLSDVEDNAGEVLYLVEHFCGVVIRDLAEVQGDLNAKRVYVCGDIGNYEDSGAFFYVIRELSYGFEGREGGNFQVIGLGMVPVVVSNAGVYFRRFFEEDGYFQRIKTAHQFQDLTESTKPGMALRKGIYLSEVLREITADENEVLRYRLLRCSSNLSGPTDNFRAVDHAIVGALNDAVKHVFEEETSLNHVLAQVYENRKKVGAEEMDAKNGQDSKGGKEGIVGADGKESKARIKAHSDKTKDMPQDGLIAFCTFYDNANFDQLKPSATDRFDWCYKNVSGLTKLHFRLKSSVMDAGLDKEFSVVLYPNSVFFIPLSTNRLYTHEIKPSMLNIDKIPTRLGYVVRCSKTEAIFMGEQVYIKENGELIPLEEMTLETMRGLKDTYVEENRTENRVKYGKVHFSMNQGDYLRPIY